MGAVLTDCWLQASVHIVDDVAKPGQRVSWSARLGGHLLATPRLGNGPWIQYLLCMSVLLALPCLRVRCRCKSPPGTRQQVQFAHLVTCWSPRSSTICIQCLWNYCGSIWKVAGCCGTFGCKRLFQVLHFNFSLVEMLVVTRHDHVNLSMTVRVTWSAVSACFKDDESAWQQKRARSNVKTNFVALVSTRALKSQSIKPKRAVMDSRSFLAWKVVTRVKAWCRTSSG